MITMRRSRLLQALTGIIAAAAMPTSLFAQEVTGTSGTTISGSGTGASSACTTIMNSAAVGQANGTLASVAVFISGTPFKVSALIGFAVGAIALFLDNGHMSHAVQIFIKVLMVFLLIGIVVSIIFSANSAVSC